MKRFGRLVINPLTVAAVLPSRKFAVVGGGDYDVLLHSGATLTVAAADAELLMEALVSESAPSKAPKAD